MRTRTDGTGGRGRASSRPPRADATPNAATGPGRPLAGRIPVVAVVVTVAVILALRAWVVEPLVVSSDSMEPTIHTGQVVLLGKLGMSGGAIDNGTVVAFVNPLDGHLAVKRVIAGAGQSVALRDAELYVDDVAVPEPFVDHSRIDGTYFGPVEVPPGSVFLLGDNRGVSIDSRDFGAVPLSSLRGTLLTGGH